MDEADILKKSLSDIFKHEVGFGHMITSFGKSNFREISLDINFKLGVEDTKTLGDVFGITIPTDKIKFTGKILLQGHVK